MLNNSQSLMIKESLKYSLGTSLVFLVSNYLQAYFLTSIVNI